MQSTEILDELLLPKALAAAEAGDFASALAITDRLISGSGDSTEITQGALLSAAIWARRSRMSRSAELLAWVGPSALSGHAGQAAAAAVATGRMALASDLVRAPFDGPPSDFVIGFRDLSMALLESVTGDARKARTTAIRAAAMCPSGRPGLVSAASVALLLCLHTGDIARASTIAERSVTTDPPDGWFTDLHILLSAWASMLAGAEDTARGLLADLANENLAERETLWALGLRCGLARRAGDIGALTVVLKDAANLLDTVSADLFSILPIGELWLGAVRTGDEELIAHLIDELDALLRSLGDPPAWASTFHWYGVQAAILANQPSRLLPHAHALRNAAEERQDVHSSVLAAAGRVWLSVLRGDFVADDVATAARTLATIGLAWDGARLASEAALRAPDTSTATALLQVARALRPTNDRGSASDPAGPLSDREVEVANLLVLGLTHKDIGTRLYISAKTVEHHVARIRRRLGAQSRAEMMSMLRAIGHGSFSA